LKNNKYFQDIWPESTCFGCGPSNPDGLQIKSCWSDDNRYVISKYHADPKFNSGMPNTMYGGTIASLIDCHSIWAAMAFAYNNENREFGSAPYLLYVTGKLSVKYIKPTPLDVPVFLKAWIDGDIGRKIRILCELGPKGAVTAAGDTVAVMVKY